VVNHYLLPLVKAETGSMETKAAKGAGKGKRK